MTFLQRKHINDKIEKKDITKSEMKFSRKGIEILREAI
jgi:hypothetical protein